MAFVVTESCIQCKYTDCVNVCPMACFYEGPNFLAIDQSQCIDCAMCVTECPVKAILHESELQPDQRHFIELNHTLATRSGWKRITRPTSPLPEHEKWAAVANKLALLQTSWKPD